MLRGFAFSVLAAVGTGVLVWLLRGATIVRDPLGIVAFLTYASPFATVVGCAVGIPIHLLFARLRIVSPVPYVCIGIVAAFAFGLLLELIRASAPGTGFPHVFWPTVREWTYATV